MYWALPIIGIILVLKGRIIYVLVKSWERIRLGKTAAARAVVFVQSPKHPNLSILILGDSTAVGTGADTSKETIAGYLGHAYPQAKIVNVGVNGAHVGQLTEQTKGIGPQQFDLAITLVGGNDVVHFSNLKELPAQLDHFISSIKQTARHILILTQGNIGNAPLFPHWLANIFTYRARKVSELVQKSAQKHEVGFLDLFVEREADLWRKNPNKYYAGDWFHPNGYGYYEWFEKICIFGQKMAWLPVRK